MRAFGISAIRRWKRGLGSGGEGKMRKKEREEKKEEEYLYC